MYIKIEEKSKKLIKVKENLKKRSRKLKKTHS